MPRTPDNTSDSQINRMIDHPLNAETILSDRPLADLTEDLRDAKAFSLADYARDTLVMMNKVAAEMYTPKVDNRRRYDIHVEYNSSAPRALQFQATDYNSYDGAPDSTGLSTCIGYGQTREESIQDLVEQINGFDEAEPATKPRAPRVVHSSPFEPPTLADVREPDDVDGDDYRDEVQS